MIQQNELPGIDLELIDELKDTLGTGFIELIDIFLDDSPTQIERMANSIDTGDMSGTRSCAHTLSGSCSNFGANRLTEICSRLRSACKANASKDELIEILSEIQLEYKTVASSVEKLRDTV